RSFIVMPPLLTSPHTVRVDAAFPGPILLCPRQTGVASAIDRVSLPNPAEDNRPPRLQLYEASLRRDPRGHLSPPLTGRSFLYFLLNTFISQHVGVKPERRSYRSYLRTSGPVNRRFGELYGSSQL